MAGSKDFEKSRFCFGFPGGDYQIMVYLGAAGEANPLFQFLLFKEFFFPPGGGRY